jgi:hypothetical protein
MRRQEPIEHCPWEQFVWPSGSNRPPCFARSLPMPKWSENARVSTTFAVGKKGGGDSFDRGGVTFARRSGDEFDWKEDSCCVAPRCLHGVGFAILIKLA